MTLLGIALASLRQTLARNALLAISFFFAFCIFGVLAAVGRRTGLVRLAVAGRRGVPARLVS